MNKEQQRALEARIQKEYGNIAGMIVMKKGVKVYDQGFHGIATSQKLHVFSLTKSILSLLMGIAKDKGAAIDMRENVLTYFPNYTIKKRETTIQTITLHDIMSMSAPYKYKSNPYTSYFSNPDWVTFSLDALGGKGTVGEFRYVPLVGLDILSGVLTQAVKQSVLDFAREQLFQPLRIQVDKSLAIHSREDLMAFYHALDISGWVMDQKGIHAAGWGLTLSCKDLASIGQLLVNGGVWEGKRILSQAWIKESTREQSYWQKRQLAYGYLWWVIDEKQHSFAALGDGGNALYVNMKKQLVIAITSCFQPRVPDRMAFILHEVEPLFEDE